MMLFLSLTSVILALAPTSTTAFVTPQTSVVRPAFVRKSNNNDESSSSTQLFAWKKIFVAGGSKGVGRQIVSQILSRQDGTAVVALVRDPAVAEELNALSTDDAPITAIVGDAMDQKTVENAMDGCDAAITTLGGKNTLPDGTVQLVDYTGNSNVIESAGILGVVRILLVTSVGCGSSKEATPEQTYETLKEVIEAKNKAENLLLKYYTNSNWTIIRPGGLVSEPMTNKAILTSDPTVLGLIHREDVARLVLKALDSAKTERQVLSAMDPSIESSFASDKPIEEFALA
mmetsp:Transcript_21422/g.27704  ORF Transcript_21422/g.27704 Transcript_21422/m.27704 type:complete len:288 (-) Transcript_21422:39-902(-)|eukprot:CAMPEP_0198145086 /NCGR_PEP_ID=MMETSP1443-20131203/21033_1 /TAXON_ID=186043 /ORGANISM="Entomoneis sp., Strain CCMP2396" /LENGTH=287 /DNA_ID=CAMNT_0043808615 /DNA_START=182 /DNA_END=1045 /DNA_ORIENTATION=-